MALQKQLLRRRVAAVAALLVVATVLESAASADEMRFIGDSPTRNTHFGSPSVPQAYIGVGAAPARVVGAAGVGVRSRVSWTAVYGPRYAIGPWRANYGVYEPWLGYSYGYNRPVICRRCGFWGRRCVCYRPPLYLPPVVIPAGNFFGPRALWAGAGMQQAPQVPPAAPADDVVPADVPPTPLNAATRARAWRYIDYGDRYFRESRYREALAQYRKASSTADVIAEAHFREGFALAALGEFGGAVTAMSLGLREMPDWPTSNFDIREFAGDQQVAEIEEGLLVKLQELPNYADARFLLGVVRHFDGREGLAGPEFSRADRLTGGAEYVQAFLPAQPAVEEPGPPLPLKPQ